MKHLVVLAFIMGCGQHHQAGTAVDAPIDTPATTFACGDPPTACLLTGHYCYLGELAGGTYYPAGGNVQEGCNVAPTSCSTCECLMQYFSAGFCGCDAAAGGPTVHCSLI